MSDLEEKLGAGYQQIVIGLIIFAIGAIWGGMSAGEGMKAEMVYWPAVTMLSGAMITLLGTTFGTNDSEDRSNDLQDSLNELTDMFNILQERFMGNNDDSEE
jgi:hypothetical protein